MLATSVLSLTLAMGVGAANTVEPGGQPSVVQQAPSPEVPTDHWAYHALEFLRQCGVVTWRWPGQQMRPLTRREFAGILRDAVQALQEDARDDRDVAVLKQAPDAAGRALDEIERLVREFRPEMVSLGTKMGPTRIYVADLRRRFWGWPREITADVGDLQVRFESRSFWTLYRIDTRGTRLCLDRFGSHYGTVARFPGVGFIGSGHTENDGEELRSLALWVDGERIDRPAAHYACREIRLEKESRIRDLLLNATVTVAGGRIVEDVTIQAEKPTPVELIYHFMHPWTDTATEYLACLPDGTRVEGAFNGDGGMRIDQPTRWSAIYDGPSGKGAVTYLLETPPDHPVRTWYWDKQGVYRKHYLVTFRGETVPAGRAFHYRAVVAPFAAAAGAWKDEAARVAEACRQP